MSVRFGPFELDVETILRRLFWQDKLLRFDVQTPRFACTCSRERVTDKTKDPLPGPSR